MQVRQVYPISPSGPFQVENVNLGLAFLRNRGFQTLPARLPDTSYPPYLCGDDQSRLNELNDAFQQDSHHLLWATRGGYGLTRILPRLVLPKGPLPTLIGFSDICALHLHLWKHRRAKGIHGPMLGRLTSENSTSLQSLWNILEGTSRETPWPILQKLYWPSQGSIQGKLIVSNLCILTHLIGTSSLPSLAGCILVLEDIDEPAYKIDRMLTQLWNALVLVDVKAIVLGQFTHGQAQRDFTPSSKEVFLERCKFFGIPLCDGLPVGHDSPNWSIPFGVEAALNGDFELRLVILEEIF